MPEELALYIRIIEQAVIAGSTMEAALNQLRHFSVPEAVIQAARVAYEEEAGIIRALRDPAALVDDRTRASTWYPGPRSDDVYWPPVKSKLLQQLPEEVVDAIDGASSKVLSVMDPPGVPLATRGLVLGYVQSGKTTSFISLISKAADVGYRVFIVLSGITDSLREQTQKRVEDTLLADGGAWYKLTRADQDFSEGTDNAVALLSQADMRFIAVVKKNPARLKRLGEWLKAAGEPILANAPILVIDDEADQASMDVAKPGGRASTINGLLKEILDQPKAAYVAYTATPFANLLANPADPMGLYPAKFIVALPEPDGYFGSEQMFGLRESFLGEDAVERDGLDVIRDISSQEAAKARPPRGKGAVYEWSPSVEPALLEAVRWFLLSTAARRARGKGNKHSTMLVHTSMLAEAHVRMASAIRDELDQVSARLLDGDVDETESLRVLYETETDRVDAADYGHSAVPFEDVWEQLPQVLADVKIITDNYLSHDRLTYDDSDPATAIVVGGNTLSRGLTLEGLSSSYFVRAASAYDTLLQMGRWFGYRQGYEDLCRVWMTDELRTWFRDLSVVEKEIRQEIGRYELEQVIPTEVAVRIRRHPDMAITAAAKMRHAAIAQMSYDAQRVQTILFSHKDAKWLDDNKRAVVDLVQEALAAGRSERRFASGRRGLAGLNADDIVSFIRKYNFHDGARTVTRSLLESYIRRENEEGSLLKWNVVFFENQEESGEGIDVGLPLGPLRALSRARLKHGDDTVANLKAIASMRDRAADIDLPTAEVTKRAAELVGAEDRITDAALLQVRGSELPGWGLLGVYPIDRNSLPKVEGGLRQGLDAAADVFGVTFFFPHASSAHSEVEYVSADLSLLVNESVEDEEAQLELIDSADSAQLDDEAAA